MGMHTASFSENQPVLLLESFTKRERDILELLGKKLSDKDIAESLVIAPSTVKWYNRQIYSKMAVSSRIQAVQRAKSLGLLDQDNRVPRHNLPPQPTALIGREREIAELLRYLDNPECRLLTLVGPGGIGKTRLALAVAEHKLVDCTDGVFFIELTSVSSPTSLPIKVASSIGYDFHPGPETPHQQVAHYLHEKRMLLVLDSVEHLIDGVALVDEMLASAPNLKIIVTSRTPLETEWEWIYEVQGLATPEDEHAGDADQYSAIQLFVERAQRTTSLTDLQSILSSIVRICRKVDGMPLGIELAASWLRAVPIQDLEKELLHLETRQRNVPVRHRSLGALLDHTWQLLSAEEQDAFMRLSVFQGGFTLAAVENIIADPLITISALVNWSLIRFENRTGRYVCHRLLEQYAESKLAAHPVIQNQLRELHCAYYVSFLKQRFIPLRDQGQLAILGEIEAEIENIRLAWQWALERNNLDALKTLCPPLASFFLLKSWYEEAIETFQIALTFLKSLPETPERVALELVLQMSLAIPLQVIRGFTDNEVGRAFEQAKDLALQTGNMPQLFWALAGLVSFYGNRAEWKTALDMTDQLYTLAERLADKSLIAIAHSSKHFIHVFRGEFIEAQTHADHVIHWYNPQQHHAFASSLGMDPAVTALCHLAWALWALGYPDQGLAQIRSAIDLAEELCHPYSMMFALAYAVIQHTLRGEPSEILDYLDKLTSLSTEHRFKHFLVSMSIFRGSALILQGQFNEGISQINQDLDAFRANDMGHAIPQMLSQLAWAYGNLDQIDTGLEIINEAIALVEQTEERNYEAEIYRIKGELLIKQNDLPAAETVLLQAISKAQRQSAKSWELRATSTLCQLWRTQGKIKTAHAMLSDMYDWFTEGFDTIDLKDARQLLHELA